MSDLVFFRTDAAHMVPYPAPASGAGDFSELWG